MDRNNKILAASAYVTLICGGILLNEKDRRKRRWWMTPLNKSRSTYSGSKMLNVLNSEPSGCFENFCRMSKTDFEYILQKVAPHILKCDTNMRKAIPVNERLAVTLRFLATGDSFKSLAYLFKFSASSISNIVNEVCKAIMHEFRDEIKMPTTPEEWLQVADAYQKLWNFPNCVGSIDGKHVVLQSPMNSGSEYINYKGTFSVVLMAVVDADYKFIFVDVGCQGRISDGGVFRNTMLYHKMVNNQLNLPEDQPLPGKDTPVPFVFVADDAFALCNNIQKPYSGVQETGSPQRVFNYRLSRARRVVESTFGIMASVFRVLRKPMLLQPENASEVVMACTLLHNFLRKSRTSNNIYTPPEIFDKELNGSVIPGNWRQDVEPPSSLLPFRRMPRKASNTSMQIRNEFASYFVSNGKVPWQDLHS